MRQLCILLALILSVPGAALASEEVPSEEPPPEEPPKPQSPLLRCAEGTDPCVRPHPARIGLAVAGVGSLAAGAALIFGLGDRGYAGDPAYLLVAGGVMATAGALVGTIFSLPGHETPVVGQRARPLFTIGLEPAGSAGSEDTVPPIVVLRMEPTLQLDRAGSTLGVHLGLGVQPARETRWDHRWDLPWQSEFEDVRSPSSREVRLDLSPRLSLPLPYPLAQGPKAPLTGRVELLWEPAIRLRRYDLLDLDGDSRVVERTSVLPLNFGIRWHLSPRQHFKLVVGPRWDLQRLIADPDVLPLGGAQANNFYGEVWYVIDVPFAAARPGPVRVSGRLELGYEQWKGDGHSLNVGSIVGYLGPMHLRWTLLMRAASSPVTAMLRVAGIVADGGGVLFEFGLAHDPFITPTAQEEPS
jgi:hypothetical protein